MAKVTADDVKALAQARGPDQVLVLTDGEVRVLSAAAAYDESASSRVIYTQAELLHEFGEEVTEAEALMLAAALTARLTETE